jgi:PTH1 family peptidyl-tRNA hydrolase
LAVDLLGEDLRATYWKDRAGAKVAAVRFGEDDLVLAKPQTFMNLSGSSVKKLIEEYGTPLAEVIIVHEISMWQRQGSKRGGPRATACGHCTSVWPATPTCACESESDVPRVEWTPPTTS